jgi:hypothetical protein
MPENYLIIPTLKSLWYLISKSLIYDLLLYFLNSEAHKSVILSDPIMFLGLWEYIKFSAEGYCSSQSTNYTSFQSKSNFV